MSDDVEFYKVPIRCWDDLLRVTGSTTMTDVEESVRDGLDSEVSIMEVTDDGIEFLLVRYSMGIVEPFPFTIEEVWDDLKHIEAYNEMPAWIEEAEEKIAEVEGFDVSIEIDEEITDPKVLASLGRYRTTGGTLVQNMAKWNDYYARKAPGTMTVEEWLRTRFFRQLPGYRVSLRGTMTTTLRELRCPTRPVKLRSYGIKQLERRERATRSASGKGQQPVRRQRAGTGRRPRKIGVLDRDPFGGYAYHLWQCGNCSGLFAAADPTQQALSLVGLVMLESMYHENRQLNRVRAQWVDARARGEVCTCAFHDDWPTSELLLVRLAESAKDGDPFTGRVDMGGTAR